MTTQQPNPVQPNTVQPNTVQPSTVQPSTVQPSTVPAAPEGIAVPTIPGRIAFGPHEADALAACYAEHGFAVLRGLWSDDALDDLTRACAGAQQRLMAGQLPARHGTTELIDTAILDGSPSAPTDGHATVRFANYVTHATETDQVIAAAAHHPRVGALAERLVGPCYLAEGDLDPFGVVYQDARPGPESSYARIGWHTDWQSGPHLDRWPSVAFTVHIDGTGPDNGFLRVVPGSHRWATPAPHENANDVPVPAGARPTGGYTATPPPFPMPLRFEKVPGEIAVYCDRGDVLFHDAYLWHSAARATDDTATRRHLRGGWYTGTPTPVSIDDFVRNAAR